MSWQVLFDLHTLYGIALDSSCMVTVIRPCVWAYGCSVNIHEKFEFEME